MTPLKPDIEAFKAAEEFFRNMPDRYTPQEFDAHNEAVQTASSLITRLERQVEVLREGCLQNAMNSRIAREALAAAKRIEDET